MKLKHITFTGVDSMTDVQRLQEIQERWPLAEFGVLTSYNWSENGNRYPAPELMSMLRGKGLNLSLHICGSAAHDAATKEWDKIDELTKGNLGIFKRVQLNVSTRNDNPAFCWIPAIIGQELIVQQKGRNDLSLYEETLKHWRKEGSFPHRDVISVLLDASGGRGIDTPIEVFYTNEKVGYAGGINPENVGVKLYYLLRHVKGDFWIDMESGVRTDDWLDLDKVEQVLTTCDQVIEAYMNGFCMKEEIIKNIDKLVKGILEKENDCYAKMAFCNEHKFEMEREAIRYAQQAYNRCWLAVSSARDEIVKLINEKQ